VAVVAIGGVLAVAAVVVAVVASQGGAPEAAEQAGEPPPPGVSKGSAAPPPPPARLDLKKFDGLAFLPDAQAAARKIHPDAELVTFDVDGVYPDGHADLTLTDEYDANYYFRSPSRSKRPADVPDGVELELPCLVIVTVSPADGVEAYEAGDEACDQPLRPVPKCSLAEVWTMATKLGAPGGNTVMQIDYLWDGWFVQIGDDTFTESLPDSCT
jgi:hypothetical protein